MFVIVKIVVFGTVTLFMFLNIIVIFLITCFIASTYLISFICVVLSAFGISV